MHLHCDAAKQQSVDGPSQKGLPTEKKRASPPGTTLTWSCRLSVGPLMASREWCCGANADSFSCPESWHVPTSPLSLSIILVRNLPQQLLFLAIEQVSNTSQVPFLPHIIFPQLIDRFGGKSGPITRLIKTRRARGSTRRAKLDFFPPPNIKAYY